MRFRRFVAFSVTTIDSTYLSLPFSAADCIFRKLRKQTGSMDCAYLSKNLKMNGLQMDAERCPVNYLFSHKAMQEIVKGTHLGQ